MKFKEKYIQTIMIIITIVMIILRFLLNEKGRTNPDSIRFMRFAEGLPYIDNTTTPLGYPAAIKLFTFIGLDEFWSSKLIGILAYLFITIFTWRKNFFFRETLITSALISFVSIYSYTMSEALTLPFVVLLLYSAMLIINNKIVRWKGILYLSLSLIAIYNIRYIGLFVVGATGLFGLLNWRKKFASSFVISGIIGFLFIILYKLLFIDYFNENYVEQFLSIGLHSTPTLLLELIQGLMTTFNPFIHIANPSGGIINYGIYGVGAINLLFMLYLFFKEKISLIESYLLTVGLSGIVCSFFIQYFYSVNPIDYRLLAPFSLPIWLVYFRKLFITFNTKIYIIGFLSLLVGFIFSWLSKGNYLENRRKMISFLESENLKNETILFYVDIEKPHQIKLAEIISTINPKIKTTYSSNDTLKRTTLTEYKVLQKIKIEKNKYQ